MSRTGWFVVLVIGIWLCAAIGTAFTRDDGPFVGAVVITVMAGAGFLLLRILS